MKSSEFAALCTNLHDESTALLLDKAQDYANEDVLSNFRRLAALCALLTIKPSRSDTDCAMFLMLLKIDRWCNLRRQGKTPNNESIKDTVKDLINYIELAYACEIDDGRLDKPREVVV